MSVHFCIFLSIIIFGFGTHWEALRILAIEIFMMILDIGGNWFSPTIMMSVDQGLIIVSCKDRVLGVRCTWLSYKSISTSNLICQLSLTLPGSSSQHFNYSDTF